MRTKGQLDNVNDVAFKSLSRGRREREMLRIAKENMNMLKRIRNKKPAISTEKLEKDWRQNMKFMDNISHYPEDWYLRERSSSHNPNMRNTKPANDTTQTTNKSSDDTKTSNNNNNNETTDYDEEFDDTE